MAYSLYSFAHRPQYILQYATGRDKETGNNTGQNDFFINWCFQRLQVQVTHRDEEDWWLPIYTWSVCSLSITGGSCATGKNSSCLRMKPKENFLWTTQMTKIYFYEKNSKLELNKQTKPNCNSHLAPTFWGRNMWWFFTLWEWLPGI